MYFKKIKLIIFYIRLINSKMKTFTIDNIDVYLGETAKENWNLLDDAEGSFTWMHLNSYPSGHVIICSDNPDINVLRNAASLCKQNTKYRNIPNLKICYSKVSNIKKEEKVGSVSFKSNRKMSTFII